MISLKPAGRLRDLPLRLDESVHLGAEGWIGQSALDFVPWHRLQDGIRVMSEFPQRGVELSPDLVRAMIPRPAKIQGEFRQGIESVG